MKNGFYILSQFEQIEVDELTFKIILEGKHMQDIKDFHQELAEKLEIPDEYGKNWDALGEVLNDLSWLDYNHFAFFIKDYDLLLQKEDFEQKSEFLSILDGAMDEWENVPNYEGEDEYREVSGFRVYVERETAIVEDLIELELDNRIIAE
jgi:RNAse (barnase) inhibitor barstar